MSHFELDRTYIDPPYPSHWPKEKGPLAKRWFDEADLVRVLKGLKGRFMLSYELEKAGIFKGFNRHRIRTVHTGTHQLGNRREYELLVTNFPLKPSKLYVEKSGEPVTKQDPVYLESPAEDETYRYVIQSHWRGRSHHFDLRIESHEKEFLIGWTLAGMIEGVVKEPVETMAEARRWSKDGSAFKIDFKTGKFKERETRAGNIVPAQLRAFPKAKEPHVWLEVEGVTPRFPAPGATRQYRGVFLIEDEGVAEYGSQKPDAHEYFLGGKLKGRLLIRRLAREALQKVLPPSEGEEGEPVTTTFWTAIQPVDQTPVVLSQHEVDKGWVPPHGVSALPRAVRKLIPTKYRYWTVEDEDERRKVRDALIQAIKDKELEIDFDRVILGREVRKAAEATVPFVLQLQTFRGPVVVRGGPSEQFYMLRIAAAPGRVMAFQLTGNPLAQETISATLEIERTDAHMAAEGPQEPGTALNPTKDTPSNIAVVDSGDAVILIDKTTFKKFEIRGEKLKGLWIAERDDVKTVLWEMARSERVSAA